MKNFKIIQVFILLVFISNTKAQVLSQENNASESRKNDIEKLIELSEANICNLNWLASEEWKDFKKWLKSEEVSKMNLQEFKSSFNEKRNTLPFTHYYLNFINTKGVSNTSNEKPYKLNFLDDKTAVLTIKSFVSDAAGMYALVQKIHQGNYKNLIIDLRDNTGGTMDMAVVLGQFLINDMIDAGAYLSRQWFVENKSYPDKQMIGSFPLLKDMTGVGFFKMLQQNKGFRMLVPPSQSMHFEGKIYILTNSITASTCEPFVALLKEKKIGKIIGRKTAGAMLTGKYFQINSNLKLFLPVADYITANGNRIDKVGVEPDIKVRSEHALQFVLENFIN